MKRQIPHFINVADNNPTDNDLDISYSILTMTCSGVKPCANDEMVAISEMSEL